MLWIIPGSPRKWSPWKWDRKTRDTCMKLRRLCMNCRCVPSPQSNSTISGPLFTATALTFLFGVGHDPDVPRNTICMGRVPEGPPLRQDEVRAALLLRANTLAMGYSGVRRILVTRLLQLLNRGVHPVIPSRGSLGASGDLAPLAHLGLVLVGEGEAEVDGHVLPGD